jgi:FMN phosphatase YigB (HAD superfamily)
LVAGNLREKIMPLTLLLDLDDTLLETNLEAFVPAYFQALGNHMANRVPPSLMLGALIRGTNLMNESDDPARTLEEIFDSSFYKELGVSKSELAEVIEAFYDNVFPSLSGHTRQLEEAASLIDWALSCGFRVAIATDPLFPRKATYHRVQWAGINPERVELISTFEQFHFTKTHPAYYAEVLGRLGWPEGPVLMVGNDVDRDLAPAHALGLATFLVDGDSATGPGFEAGHGKLADLRPWLESVNLSTLEPAFKSKEAILAIMTSTPAVLHSITRSLPEDEWRHEPTRDDWAMNEIICHLRDTEREIHQLQLHLMLERDGAFIPRPETGIWANEREYLNVNGLTALAEFTSARLKVLKTLKEQSDRMWSRKARHAIFGPTNFLEVLSFVTDHDRLHVQQAWKTLQSIQA